MKVKTSDIIVLMATKAGLTQRELSKKAGISEVTISRYINGKREPDFKTFLKIAGACNYDVIIQENAGPEAVMLTDKLENYLKK